MTTLGDGICHALRGVRNLGAREGGTTEVDARAGGELGDPDLVAWRGHPVAVRRGQPVEKILGADRTDDVDGRAPRGQLAVLPGEEQAWEISVVVDMEVAQRDVS